jgi:ABC-type antimicrobial peptide transport system permease subunit
LAPASSLAAGRLIASLLFGIEPTDAGMVVLLLAVALVAGYLSALRASRIDPLMALWTN